MKGKPGRLRIGTSGWQYRHWRDVFYPHETPQRQWFDHYAWHFDTVEINNTFYRLPPPETFDRWRRRAPPGFLFAVKFSRFGTHMKRLLDAESTIANFTAAASELGPTLGPALVQLPPNWRADPARLADFLRAAQRFPPTFRWAFEFRDASWLCDPVFEILRACRAALVIHDKIAGHPRVMTADWTYIRYHSGREQGGNYSPRHLHAESVQIRRMLANGRDVFVYFNNDAHGHAVSNALDLRRFVLEE